MPAKTRYRRDVDPGQLGRQLVVAQGPEGPADVGALEQPVDHEIDDDQAEEDVVGRHLVPEERVGPGLDHRARSRRR